MRADDDTDRELDYLGDRTGTTNRSKIISRAVHLYADHLRREDERSEAERLAADPIDRAEIAAIQSDMEYLHAW